MTEPLSIAACLRSLDIETLDAFASSHRDAADALTTQGRDGESAWQEAIAIVLSLALLDRLGEPSSYEIDDEERYLATIAGELDDLALATSVFRFVAAYAKNRDTLSSHVVAALAALNRPLLEEYQHRPPPPLSA